MKRCDVGKFLGCAVYVKDCPDFVKWNSSIVEAIANTQKEYLIKHLSDVDTLIIM